MDLVCMSNVQPIASWGMEPNRKMFPDHLPSIFYNALVGAGSLWRGVAGFQQRYLETIRQHSLARGRVISCVVDANTNI